MKFINKIDWTKVKEPMLVVTKTNIGNNENPSFQVHYLKNGVIFDKGIFDARRFINVCNSLNYDINDYFGTRCESDSQREEVIRGQMYQSSVGLLMKLTGLKVKQISELI